MLVKNAKIKVFRLPDRVLNITFHKNMIRIKRSNIARRRRKKLLHLAKGFKGAHSRLFRVANQQVMKSLIYAYVGRKHRKREHKILWIRRVNAISRSYGLPYNILKHFFRFSSIIVNLKMTAQMALLDRPRFYSLWRIAHILFMTAEE